MSAFSSSTPAPVRPSGAPKGDPAEKKAGTDRRPPPPPPPQRKYPKPLR